MSDRDDEQGAGTPPQQYPQQYPQQPQAGYPQQPQQAAAEDFDDLPDPHARKFPGWPEITGLIAGLVPFVISVESSSVSTANGRVVSASYSNPIAVIGGIVAALFAIIGLAMLKRTAANRKAARIVACVLILGLGGFQMARGFGAFFDPGSKSRSRSASRDDTWREMQRVPPRPRVEKKVSTRAEDEKALDKCLLDNEESFCPRARQVSVNRCRGGAKGESCADASMLLVKGRGGPKDPVQGAELARLGCEKGEQVSCSNVGYFTLEGIGVEKDLARAQEILERSCAAKGAAACKNLGMCWRDGGFGRKDPVAARAAFEKACSYDSAVSCLNLGVMLLEGDGGPKEDAAARAMTEKGCKLGNTHACKNLGIVLARGIGGPKDLARARSVLTEACKKGNPEACYKAGWMWVQSEGGRPDKSLGVQFVDQACSMKNVSACSELAMQYRDGKLLERDLAKAKAYFAKACAEGHAESCKAEKALAEKK